MDIVTIRQAKKLKKLGFNEETCHYLVEGLDVKPMKSYPTKWNTNKGYDGIKPKYPYIAVPTVEQAINWLVQKNRKIKKRVHKSKKIFPENQLFTSSTYYVREMNLYMTYTTFFKTVAKTYVGSVRKMIAFLIKRLENG